MDRRSDLANRLLDAGWVLAGVPIATSAFVNVRRGWIPGGDVGIVAAKTVDVFSDAVPLVGGWTSLGQSADEPLHHAGPLGLWLLAVPTRVFGPPGGGMVVGAALLALVSLVAIALLARRTMPLRMEVALLALTLGAVARLGGERLTDPNAPHVGVLPLLVSMVATIAIVAGSRRSLWVLVMAGSLAAQTHLGYAPLILVLVALAAAVLAIDARRDGDARALIVRRTAPVGIGIGLVAWSGPIIDQLFGSQNLTRLLSTRAEDDGPTVGLGQGLDLAVDTAAVPGGWIRQDAADGVLAEPGLLAYGWAICMVVAVAVFGVDAWRRRDRLEFGVALVGGVMLVVGTISAASVKTILIGTGLLYYRLFWWPVGVVFTLAVAAGVMRVLRDSRPRLAEQPRLPAGAAGLTVVLALVVVPAAHSAVAPDSVAFFEATVDHAAAIDRLLGSDAAIVLRLDDPATERANDAFAVLLTAPSMIAELRLHGVDVEFPDEPFDPTSLGPIAAYQFDNRAPASGRPEVWFRVGDAALEPPPEGFTVVSFDEGSAAPLRFPSAVWLADG